MATFTETLFFNVIECAQCGVAFGVSKDFQERRREDHEGFFCPAGHSNVYTGASEAQLLRRVLEQKENELRASKCETLNERNLREAAEVHAAKFQRKLKRVKKGVCPCCNRSFSNLARHMASKHSEPIAAPK
jgi:hypothetical protein